MSYKLFIDEDILDCGNIALASDGLCEDCFDYVVSHKCKDDISSSLIKEKLRSKEQL